MSILERLGNTVTYYKESLQKEQSILDMSRDKKYHGKKGRNKLVKKFTKQREITELFLSELISHSPI